MKKKKETLMEAILISLITHLSLLIVLFQAGHSATVTENNGVVADHWRQYHPNIQHLEDSMGMSTIILQI